MHLTHPFRNHLYTQCRSVILTVLDTVKQGKNGALWWHLLPIRGKGNRYALTRDFTRAVYTACYPPAMLSIMLRTALNDHGAIDSRGQPLYTWLLANVYNGSTEALYDDWLILIKMERAR
jgi:hypothetical protein